MFVLAKIFISMILLFRPYAAFARDPSTMLKNSRQKTCSPQQMREAMIFISDYLGCIAGNESNCLSITDAVANGLSMSAISATTVGSVYTSKKLVSMADNVLSSKKFAKDSHFARTVAQQWGGKDVDQLLAQHKGDSAKAVQAIDTQLKAYDKKDLSPKLEEKKIQLEQQKKQINARASIENSNKQLLSLATEKTDRINDYVLRRAFEIDQKMAEIDVKLRSAEITKEGKSALREELKALASQKKVVLADFQSIDTQIKDVADAYNKQLEGKIKKLRSQVGQNLEVDKRVKETISEISKKRISPKGSAASDIPRYVMNVDKEGISFVDINSKFDNLPKWAQELRISQVREFPNILKKVVTENPGILDNQEKFFDKLAEQEHERYRVATRERIIKSYEADRILSAKEGNTIPDLKFTEDAKFKPFAEFNETQQKALTNLKPNFKEVDIPYSQLSEENIAKTRPAVIEQFAERVPTWSEGEKFSKISKFFIEKPGLGKALGKGVKYAGLGVVDVALIWYDWYPMKDLAIGLAFENSQWVQENFWSNIAPQCRMPREQRLEAPDTVKEASKRFCKCQEEEKKADELSSLCQVPPTDMDNELKEYCLLAKGSGRDRDLLIAKKYKEHAPKNPRLREILKSSPGCDVMKNYPAHCRWTTNELTDQGLYFMSLIQDNKLYEPVSELCPDVCQHWIDVANQKIKQIKGLNEFVRLPTTPEKNKAEKTCSPSVYLDEAPTNYEKRNEWRKCQPPIICQGAGKARVSLPSRNLEHYNIQYDPQTETVKTVRHSMSHIQNKINGNGHGYLSVDTKSTFDYAYNSDGELSKVQIHNFQNGSDEAEVVLPQDILGRFGEAAYNANSSQMRSIGELAINKRIEIMLMTRQAINYCCRNEVRCSSEENLTVEPLRRTPSRNAEGTR